MKRYQRIVALLLTLGLVIGLLAWSLHDVPAGEVLAAFGGARWQFFPLAVLTALLVFVVKAYRWRFILGEASRASLRTLFSAIMIGFMVNCIFSRVGEVVRAAVLGVKRETRTATAFASIALERIFDLASVCLFLVVALLWLPTADSTKAVESLASVRWAGVALGLLFAAGVLFLVLLRLKSEGTIRLALFCVSWLPGRLRPHVEGFLESFLKGLNTLRSVRQVLWLMALSLVHWMLQTLYFLFIGYCFPGLGLALSGAMLIFAISALGVAALPTPGYLGVYQGAIIMAGKIMAVPASDAALFSSYTWLCWAGNIPPIILVGFVFLWVEGLKLSELRAGAAKDSEDP